MKAMLFLKNDRRPFKIIDLDEECNSITFPMMDDLKTENYTRNKPMKIVDIDEDGFIDFPATPVKKIDVVFILDNEKSYKNNLVYIEK